MIYGNTTEFICIHIPQIYDKRRSQSAKVLALPQEQALQDNSNDTLQTMCELHVSFHLLRTRINQDKL